MMSCLRKSSLIVFSLLITHNLFGQNDYCRYQDDFVLDWSYFRGQVDTNATFGAMSTMGIGYSIGKYDSLIVINIGAYFYPDSSWVRSETPEGLTHEVYHFKITEISRRFMLKELSEIQIKYNFIDDLTENRLVNYSWYHDGEQRLYDRETNYGLDTLKQKEHEIRIDNQLEMLRDYNKNYLLLHIDGNKEIKFTEMSNNFSIDTKAEKE